MRRKIFSGILFAASGSFWWGILGVFYFKSIAFVSPLELVVHRTVWSALTLSITLTLYAKWDEVFNLLKRKNILLGLLLSSILIITNWYTWIYAVTVNKLIDASFGYYIYPILSAFFGIIFLKESYNKTKLISFILVLISIIILFFNFDSIPWIGLVVAASWSLYTLVRKVVKVPADIGLFIESLLLTPLALFIFYNLFQGGENFFSFNDIKISVWLFLAGAMTLIPLFLFLKGTEKAGLGVAGMIFFIVPTCHFLLGVFYFNETLDLYKLLSFSIIWIAVAIFLRDLASDN
jgi:chloramphenicol-sensitive protein RarD